MIESERPTAAEWFNAGLGLFQRGEVEESISNLRAGIFENLYIAPTLLREEFEAPEIWYPGADSEPRAADEYALRYGVHWSESGDALRFLGEIWSDSLVRSEVRSFVNVSKAILQSANVSQQADLIRERDRFVDLRRIRTTQRDILTRLELGTYRAPIAKPRVGLIVLAARDTKATVDFYRVLFQLEPMRTSRLAGGYAEFELPGVRIAIHGHDQVARDDPYSLGAPPSSLGWGAIFVLRVEEFDRYYGNAVSNGLEIVDRELDTNGQRYFLVKDPSGYLIEVTEEELG